MNQILRIIVGIFIVICFCFSNCRKDGIVSNGPTDQLPPETQTSANTFGCLVNGEIFIPKGSPFAGPYLSCSYQKLNDRYDTGYFFHLAASSAITNTYITGINVVTDSLEVNSNTHYLLKDGRVRGGSSAEYFINSFVSSPLYRTNKEVIGDLYISKFDLTNQIASGTFWFNAIGDNGDTVKVTKGRFDMRFTR